MTSFVRSDKVAGLATGTLGLGMVLFGSFALVIVAFQRTMMRSIPPNDDQFGEMMIAVHGVFITYLPFMIAGGLVFAAAGFFIYRGSPAARRIAQVNTVVGVVWIITYSITSYRMIQKMPMLPPVYQDPVFQWGSIIVNLIILLAFPAALFYILSHPKRNAGS